MLSFRNTPATTPRMKAELTRIRHLLGHQTLARSAGFKSRTSAYTDLVWRVIVAVAVVLAVIAAAAGYVWMRLQPSPIPPLESNWRATVSVVAAGERFSEPFGIAAASDGTVFVSDAG